MYVTDSELSLFVGVRLLRVLGRLPEHVLCTLEACESLNSMQRNQAAHQLHAVTDEDIKRACMDGNQKAYGADELQFGFSAACGKGVSGGLRQGTVHRL